MSATTTRTRAPWGIPRAPRRVRATMVPHHAEHRWAGQSAPYYLIEAPLVACYAPRTRARSIVTSWRWVAVAILDDPQQVGPAHSGVMPWIAQ